MTVPPADPSPDPAVNDGDRAGEPTAGPTSDTDVAMDTHPPTSVPHHEKRQTAGSRRLVNRFAGPIDAFHIMTEADAEKANTALERLIETDSVEQDILGELLDSHPPLAEPHAFLPLHRTFVRALEVYDRNARRSPTGLPLGFLAPVISPLVRLMTLAISRWYQRRVLRDVRRLYVLREANSPVGSPEHRMLGTARRQLDALRPDLSGFGFALPAFLLGSALLSAVASLLQNMLYNDVGRFALLAGVLIITLFTFSCLLTAASITRRRTRLVLDQPVGMLWRAIGAAGRPPQELSRVFVAVATLLLLIGWIVVPLAVAVIYGIT